MSELWENIPTELIWTPQWCLAGPNELGQMKVPMTVHGTKAKSNDPTTWTTFQNACDAAIARGWGIGFVLSANDPYSVIDLDVKDADNLPDKPEKWTTPEQLARYASIVESFSSYTEVSTSGKGVHIWLLANIGMGRKREGIEVYSQERFIVCTGNVYVQSDILDRQDMLSNMVSQMETLDAHADADDWVDGEQSKEDMELVEQLSSQENGAKFSELYAGNWSQFGYPSQSEADFALMSMFAFVTDNDAQCLRLFRSSGLGKRDKATKNDAYLTKRCLAPIRRRQMDERAAIAHGQAMAAAMMSGSQALIASINAGETNLINPPEVSAADDYVVPEVGNAETTLPWPPGNAGNLAYVLYQNLRRPVPEVAIISVLGLLAGIAGKAYKTESDSGLNNYFVLIARSGVGKEGMHDSINYVLHSMMSGGYNASIAKYVDMSEYASGQALMKAVTEKNCFLNVTGEFGRKLKLLALDNAPAPTQMIRTAMTNYYSKSSTNSVVGGLGYSDKEKNTASVTGVAYSMVGETTPDTFNESLTTSMMQDGFLSRFVMISYEGLRPPLNLNPKLPIPPHLLTALSWLVAGADGAGPYFVKCTEEARAYLRKFSQHCDDLINGPLRDDDSQIQMWSRAELKAWRMGSSLATFDNPQDPVMTLDHIEWALMVVQRDIDNMTRKLKNGDVGTGDTQREEKLVQICIDYCKAASIPPGYSVPKDMHKRGVVSRTYLQRKVQRVNSFTSHKLGFNNAFDGAIRNLCTNGQLKEIPSAVALKDYGFSGKCFAITIR
jgi:hypothetical protein